MSYPRRETAKTCGGVAVTAASSVIVASNPSRLSLTIQNTTGGAIYLKFSTARPTTTGGTVANPVATADAQSLKLLDGASFTTTDYIGPVAAIAGGSVTATVVEF